MAGATQSLLTSPLLIAAGILVAGVLAIAQNCGCADVASQQFFDGIIGQNDNNCEANGFYTRDAFINAWQQYPSFAEGATFDDSEREIAAFFAHVSHETSNMCYKDQIDQSNAYCDPSSQQYPCAQGKMYFGRGPLQITWNYNYGSAGEDIGFDGLNWPEAVESDATISFKTALWFWMQNVHGIFDQGFGATIQAINDIECGGGDPQSVNDRVTLYQNYCNQFGVSPGDNLYC